MSIAVLSDLHANLEATEAVLAAVADDQVSAVYVLGDIVGYGADPGAVLEHLWARDDAVLLSGNHDLAASGRFDARWFNPAARAAIEWTADALEGHVIDRLGELEPSCRAPAGLCVHGSVVDPAVEYVFTVEAAARSFEADPFEVCFFGHTHLPTIFRLDGAGVVAVDALRDGETVRLAPGERVMLNPGSVGQPRDGDPRASYLLFDPDDATVRLRRVRYDVEAAQRKIRSAGLPDLLAARLAEGR